VIALLPTLALAYETIGATWETQPVPYWINADLPAYLDRDETLAAARAGLEVWANADCGFSVSYQGEHAGGPPGIDGLNVIYIVSVDWREEPTLLTAPLIGVSGNDIVEADLMLNAEFFDWTTDGDLGQPAFDVQGAVAHESGHFVGLDEVDLSDQTMNPLHNGTEAARSLGTDDIAGLCALYEHPTPLGGEGDPCLETDDCEAGRVCVAAEGERTCTATPHQPEGCGCTHAPSPMHLWCWAIVFAVHRRRLKGLFRRPSGRGAGAADARRQRLVDGRRSQVGDSRRHPRAPS